MHLYSIADADGRRHSDSTWPRSRGRYRLLFLSSNKLRRQGTGDLETSIHDDVLLDFDQARIAANSKNCLNSIVNFFLVAPLGVTSIETSCHTLIMVYKRHLIRDTS